MTANPLLKKLGLSDNDRVVIFHADDIGMCHASYAAYVELVDNGLFSSAATMVPCGWFPATAVYCRTHQETHPHIDMGVHMTFTSEWDDLRWGPISMRDKASGLMDEEGFFFRSSAGFQGSAQLEAVKTEMQ
ncbi:ChbG/HpnK family deacetylase, partial [Vibrio sp.]|uniref:ChbG/HpnK family deacetylase n=1 Tax=Vibrio sp. TaxID=678 RepID=UPI003D0CB8FE